MYGKGLSCNSPALLEFGFGPPSTGVAAPLVFSDIFRRLILRTPMRVLRTSGYRLSDERGMSVQRKPARSIHEIIYEIRRSSHGELNQSTKSDFAERHISQVEGQIHCMRYKFYLDIYSIHITSHKSSQCPTIVPNEKEHKVFLKEKSNHHQRTSTHSMFSSHMSPPKT